jgi:DUF438 domain-containing protein
MVKTVAFDKAKAQDIQIAAKVAGLDEHGASYCNLICEQKISIAGRSKLVAALKKIGYTHIAQEDNLIYPVEIRRGKIIE